MDPEENETLDTESRTREKERWEVPCPGLLDCLHVNSVISFKAKSEVIRNGHTSMSSQILVWHSVHSVTLAVYKQHDLM